MSLNWRWNDVIGECIYKNGCKSTLYKGNAQIIAINHLPDDMYNLAWFSSDKYHLRNMLGLSKGYDGILDENKRFFGIETIKLNTRYKIVSDIVKDFAKAKVNINIELYFKEEEEQENI